MEKGSRVPGAHTFAIVRDEFARLTIRIVLAVLIAMVFAIVAPNQLSGSSVAHAQEVRISETNIKTIDNSYVPAVDGVCALRGNRSHHSRADKYRITWRQPPSTFNAINGHAGQEANAVAQIADDKAASRFVYFAEWEQHGPLSARSVLMGVGGEFGGTYRDDQAQNPQRPHENGDVQVDPFQVGAGPPRQSGIIRGTNSAPLSAKVAGVLVYGVATMWIVACWTILCCTTLPFFRRFTFVDLSVLVGTISTTVAWTACWLAFGR